MKVLTAFAALAIVATAVFAASNSYSRATPRRVVKGGKLGGPTIPSFFIGATGPGTTPEPNTRLATLWEVQSADFVNYFNFNGGLPVDPNADIDGCCLFSIAEGFLTLRGSVENFQNYSYVAPFSQGQHICASQLQGPIAFGCVEGFGWCQGQYIGNLTSSVVSRFAYVPTIASAVGCPGSSQSFGVFVAVTPKPKFVIAGVGSNFPTPPTGYQTATLADVQSSSFISEYNNWKLEYTNPTGAAMDGCCLFAINGGYLTDNQGDWLSLYTQQGQFDCTTNPATKTPLGLGYGLGQNVGPNAGQFIPSLSKNLTAGWTVTATASNGLGCGQFTNSFGLFIQTS